MNSELTSYLGISLLKLTLVLAISLALLHLLRRAEPRWRLQIARATYLALPLVLIAAAVDPRLSLPLPSKPAVVHDIAPQTAAIPSTLNKEATPRSAATVLGSPPESPPASPVPWLVGAWLLITAILVIREFTHLRQALEHSNRQNTMSANASLKAEWTAVRRDFGIRPTDLRVTSDNVSPYLSPGLFAHALIIPRSLADSNGDLRRLLHALRHEAAHLSHRDPRWLPLARFITCFLWFHPFVWWLESLHLSACEESSDAEAVRRGGGDAAAYSGALASLALELLPKPLPATALLRRSSVTRRLKAVERHARTQPPRRWKRLAAAGFLLLSGVITGNLGLAEPKAPAHPLSGKAEIEEILSTTIIPSIELVDMRLQDALDIIRIRTADYNPEDRSFIISYHPSADSLADARINLRLSNATVGEVLRNATRLAGAGFVIEETAVLLVSQEKAPEIAAAHAAIGRVVIPLAEFVETPLADAIDFLNKKVTELDPQKRKIKIIFDVSALSHKDKKLTLRLSNSSFAEALRYTTKACGAEYIDQGNTILIVSKEKAAQIAAADPNKRAREGTIAFLETTTISSVGFVDTPLAAAFDFLWEKTIDLDPKRMGVRIVLDDSARTKRLNPVNLSFEDVPLMETIRSTADLAGLTYLVQENTVLILSKEKAETLISGSMVTVTYGLQHVQSRLEAARKKFEKSTAVEALTREAGVTFPPGATATFHADIGELEVRNTEENLKLVHAWVIAFPKLPKVESNPVKLESEIDEAVPAAEQGGDPDRQVGEIIVNMREGGSIVVNGVEVTEEQLYTRLEQIADEYPDQAVILQGDYRTQYEHIINVLDICKQANIWNVAFATNRPENAPEKVPASNPREP